MVRYDTGYKGGGKGKAPTYDRPAESSNWDRKRGREEDSYDQRGGGQRRQYEPPKRQKVYSLDIEDTLDELEENNFWMRDDKDRAPAVMELQAPKNCEGCFCGRNDRGIQKIKQLTGCVVMVEPDPDDQRYIKVIIRGEVFGVTQVVHIVAAAAAMSNPEEQVVINILIPHGICGAIVGAKGAGLGHMLKISRAKSKLHKEVLPCDARQLELIGGDPRDFSIIGYDVCRNHAFLDLSRDVCADIGVPSNSRSGDYSGRNYDRGNGKGKASFQPPLPGAPPLPPAGGKSKGKGGKSSYDSGRGNGDRYNDRRGSYDDLPSYNNDRKGGKGSKGGKGQKGDKGKGKGKGGKLSMEEMKEFFKEANADGSGNISSVRDDGTRFFNTVEIDTARGWFVEALDELISGGFIHMGERDDVDCKFQIMVPDEFVAAICGFKGQCVKEIKRIAEVDMKFVRQEQCASDGKLKLRTCNLEGRLRNVMMAVHMCQKVMVMLSSNQVLEHTPAYIAVVVPKSDQFDQDEGFMIDVQSISECEVTAKPSGMKDGTNRVDIDGQNIPEVSNAVAMILRKLFPHDGDDSYYPPDGTEQATA